VQSKGNRAKQRVLLPQQKSKANGFCLLAYLLPQQQIAFNFFKSFQLKKIKYRYTCVPNTLIVFINLIKNNITFALDFLFAFAFALQKAKEKSRVLA
jgi:hypothetical protein